MKTDEELLQMLAIAQAATPGPWFPVVADGTEGGLGNRDDLESERGFTVSADPNRNGWCTDGGYPNYTVGRADAQHMATFNPKVCAELVTEIRQRRAAKP